MALFTDSAIVTVEDLTCFEASLVQVASAHGINIDAKVNLATAAIGDKLMLWLLNSGTSDPQWLNRRLLGLSTVVVSSLLNRWLCLESLSRIYAEAYNAQLNTRYQGKVTEYQNEAQRAENLFYLTGLGIVANPLPRPVMPLVSVQSGNVPSQSVFISTTWVDANGNESAMSAETAIELSDNSSIAVAMAEGALGAPRAAAYWNVYGGSISGSLTLQNASTLEIGSTWNLPSTGLQIGAAFPGDQLPNYCVALARQIRRG